MAPSAATPIMRELHHVQYTPPELPHSGKVVPTRTPRFGTLEEMAAARKRSLRPHTSYALDKPPHDMTQRDFFLARKFDADGKGFLTEQEQAAAKNALAEGYGQDHYSDYYAHKPQTRFQKTLQSTLPFAPTSYSDTFNRCLTEFDERHGSPTPASNNLTRSKLFRMRTQAEQEELAKKIQKGWTESINRLRPNTKGSEKNTLPKKEGYVEKPKHKTRSEILQSRQEKRYPKDGYDWDDTQGIGAREFFIASLFDKGHKLDLTPEERAKMEDAIKQGLGQDSMETYFSHKRTPPDSRVARVLRHTFKLDARCLKDSFNRTIGNECGGFEARNDEAQWVSTTQQTHGVQGDTAKSPLDSWRQAGKPVGLHKAPKFNPTAPTTDHLGFHTKGEHDTGTYRVTADDVEEKALVEAEAAAQTDRTHVRSSQKPSPPLSARVRPSTSDGMRGRYNEWSSPRGRPASQGRAAGLPLPRNKGQGCLNMFWPMPPRRN